MYTAYLDHLQLPSSLSNSIIPLWTFPPITQIKGVKDFHNEFGGASGGPCLTENLMVVDGCWGKDIQFSLRVSGGFLLLQWMVLYPCPYRKALMDSVVK